MDSERHERVHRSELFTVQLWWEEIHHVEHIRSAQRRTTTRYRLLGAVRLYPEGDASTDRGAEPECRRASARWPTAGLWTNVAENLLDDAQRRRCHTDRAHHGLEAPLSRVLAQAISFLSIAVRHCSGGSGPH